jgi:hypothetical protein
VLALLLLLLLLLILRSVAHWGPGGDVATSTIVARISAIAATVNSKECVQGACLATARVGLLLDTAHERSPHAPR